MKTIFMDKELKDKWVAALRSGEYKQGRRKLFYGIGYCCLGVLQMVADGKVEMEEKANIACPLPSKSWLDSHKVVFAQVTDEGNTITWFCHSPTLLPSSNFPKNADALNDSGATFSEIADLIEECWAPFEEAPDAV